MSSQTFKRLLPIRAQLTLPADGSFQKPSMPSVKLTSRVLGLLRPSLTLSLGCKVLAVAFYSAPALAWTLAIGPDLFCLFHLLSPSAQGFGRIVTSFKTQRREIWLTIDDGPDPASTPWLLDLLDRYHARASFFLIGEKAQKFPNLVSEILRRGHQIGNHTHSHPLANFWCASPQKVSGEIDLANQALSLVGFSPRYFRSPAGIKSPFCRRLLAERKMIHIGWSVRGFDGVRCQPERVVARIMRRVKSGSIILVHERAELDPNYNSVGMLLARLEEAGYQCVLPSESQLCPKETTV